MLRIRIRMDQYNFGKLGPDPHQIEEQNPDPHQIEEQNPDPHQIEDQNPDLHRSEKVEALEDHFGALEGPNLAK